MNLIKVTRLNQLSQKDYQRIMKRSAGTNPEILPGVKKIMQAVKKTGDVVLLQAYQKRFGKQNNFSLKVSREEIRAAYKKVDKNYLNAIKQAIKNITAVHQAQLSNKKDTVVLPEKGISVWRVWRPIEKVGLYIPGGKAIYPSSVLMSAIPAKVAGCREIIMCSPPRDQGQIPAPTLVAADMVGVEKIFKTGGVEAVAAMTYGTQTVPRVYKIFGAGNSYVTAAKILALDKVSIDLPAGPSEVFVIADKTANPAFIAADLLADGEHGEDSACVLVTTSKKVAQATVKAINKQLKNLPTADLVKESLKRYGLIAVVNSLDQAINFTNDYAPEHLSIMTKNPESLVKQITNAGSIFLGAWTTKSSGDYATGANHVLPTGGAAKMYPPLGVDSYGKWMQVQKCTEPGLGKIRKTIEVLSETEKLPAHKVSAQIRFTKK